MRDLVIFGSGGMARETYQIVQDINQEKKTWNFLGFVDDDVAKHGKQVHRFPILGDAEWLRANNDVWVVIAIGNTIARRKIALRAKAYGISSFATLIHPQVWKGRHIEIGEGTIICAGSLLTTDIEIGKHVIVNLACTITHDVVIHDYVTVAPGVNISGAVMIEEGVDLGTGSTTIQGIKIGKWSIIGAGAVVTKDVPANVTTVGIPAKPIKQRQEDKL